MKTSPFLYSVYSLSLVSALIVTSCVPPAQKTTSPTPQASVDMNKVVWLNQNQQNPKQISVSQKTTQNFTVKNAPLDTDANFIELTFSPTYTFPVNGVPQEEDLGLGGPFRNGAPHFLVEFSGYVGAGANRFPTIARLTVKGLDYDERTAVSGHSHLKLNNNTWQVSCG